MKAPAFQFYARDWLSDGKRMAMPLAARGAYIDLLASQWLEGFVPASLEAMRRLVGADPDEWAAIAPYLETAFPCCMRDGVEVRVNPRLERERLAQAERRAARSEAGQRGASARWTASPTHGKAHGNAIANGMTNPMAKAMAKNSTAVAVAVASASARTTPTSPPADDVAFSDILTRVPNPAAFHAERDAMLAGMPSHPHATGEQIARACRDLLAATAPGQSISLRAFRRFVEKETTTTPITPSPNGRGRDAVFIDYVPGE